MSSDAASSSAAAGGGVPAAQPPPFVHASLAERLFERDSVSGDALFRAPLVLRLDADEVPYADAEYKSVRAGRSVLAAMSVYFRAMYAGGMAEAAPGSVLTIDDADAQTLRALLQCAYTDALPDDFDKCVDTPRLVSLSTLAQRMLLEAVRDKALTLLLDFTRYPGDAYNVLDAVYDDEHATEERELACGPAIELALKVIADADDSIVYSGVVNERFLLCSPRVVTALLSKLTSAHCSGDELLAAVCAWAKEHAGASTAPHSTDSDEPAAKRARTDDADSSSSDAAAGSSGSAAPASDSDKPAAALLLDVLPHFRFGTVSEAAIVRHLAVDAGLPAQVVMELLMSKATGTPRGRVTARQLSRLLFSNELARCGCYSLRNSKSTVMLTVPDYDSAIVNFFAAYDHEPEFRGWVRFASALQWTADDNDGHTTSSMGEYEKPKGAIVSADVYFSITAFAPIALTLLYACNHRGFKESGEVFGFNRDSTGGNVLMSPDGRAPIAVTQRVLILCFRRPRDGSGLRFSLVDAASGSELSAIAIPLPCAPVLNIVVGLRDISTQDITNPAGGYGCAAQLRDLHTSVMFDPSAGAVAGGTPAEPQLAAAAAGAGAGAGAAGAGGGARVRADFE